MHRGIAVAALVGLMALMGCSLDATDTEEGLVRAAFEAIRRDNWADYSRLTITTCDFILKEQKVGRFEQKQSFAGGVLKPEEISRQKAQYRQAVAGGPGQIDFRKAKFVAVGSVVDQGDLETLSGGQIPFKTYAIRVESPGAEAALSPSFVVVPWQRGYRLLRLDFQGDGSG